MEINRSPPMPISTGGKASKKAYPPGNEHILRSYLGKRKNIFKSAFNRVCVGSQEGISIGSIDARTSFIKELRCSIWNLGHFFVSNVHETQDSRTAFFRLCQAIRTRPRSYPGHLAWQEQIFSVMSCSVHFSAFGSSRLSTRCREMEANFAKLELWIDHCTDHTKTNKHIHVNLFSLFRQLWWSFSHLKPSHHDEIPYENL